MREEKKDARRRRRAVERLALAHARMGALGRSRYMMDKMRLFGQLSWVCALLADRDLVFQDFSLVLVPGMRLGCWARAGARGVRRSARTE